MLAANRGITEEEYRRFRIMCESFRTFDCTEELRKIKCPVLVIGCEGDKTLGTEGSAQIAEILGCGLYLYGKEYGHGVYDEAPDFRNRCFAFLNEERAE